MHKHMIYRALSFKKSYIFDKALKKQLSAYCFFTQNNSFCDEKQINAGSTRNQNRNSI